MFGRRYPTLALACFAIVVAGGGLYAQQPASQTSAAQSRQHILARERWQMSGRRVLGANAAALRNRAIQQKMKMRAARAVSQTSPGVSGVWVSLGPLPLPSDASGIGLQDYGWVTGRATAVAIDPNDASGNTVFAGGAYGGVWKSNNAGRASLNPVSVNWTPLTDNQPTLAVGAIAIQPQLVIPDPTKSVVLVGTGETNSSVDSYYGLGILRSADGGATWAPIISQDSTGTHSFAGLGFSQIAFSSANPSLVVVAAASASQGILEGLVNPALSAPGLYYSTDAGINWQAASVSDAGTIISPASATSVAYNAAANTFYAAIRFHGFYSSPDGINWTRLASQPGSFLTAASCPPQTVLPSSCPIYRGEIAVVPPRPNQPAMGEMYLWSADASDGDQGIWQSVDAGASWSRINDSGINNCGDVFGGCGTAQGSYNLTLAAVPNGTSGVTDLYAGAENLYKCTITNAFPTCNGAGSNTFMNLTHVYGCSDIAKVHPDQHAMDFLVANGTVLLYFANDGGIYRAQDGFTGLTTGTCGMSNQFDSLNATLGPMTQFVSVSQAAADVNLIFGGTQGNGAPATAFSQSPRAWANVNAGDNGFTAINPADENEWFVATPPDSASGVNLFRCANGIGCQSQDFQNDQVADSNQLNGDTGAFYLPFLLDPQNSGQLLLGTCQVWRGISSGGGFSLLSPDFETGGTGACSGSEVNLVRTLAAGGPKDSNSYSQVIYAGTNGDGPLIPTVPGGGHLWVTTNSDGGPVTWSDRTGPINPQGFPISSVALDSSDPLGKTAYVTIMGFNASHVWKTSNAGVSWIDFSGNLPDAPANAIVVDPGGSLLNGTIYVGTDVGVFASSTGTASWIEVAPSFGTQGLLPNTAVTSLAIFNSGNVKRLRAATYGRGIWEWNLVTAPAFQIYVPDNPITIFAGQTATFNGTIQALNGYNSNVSLSCISGFTVAPQICAPTPTPLLPIPAGTGFTVSASGGGGDYAFNLHALGSDPNALTLDFSLTLHIVDFDLSPPTPNSVSVIPGNVSPPLSLVVSGLGSFAGAVALSCSGLPSGASCQFQPSNTVSPVAANPISVNMTMSTSSNTPLGTSQINITASSPGGTDKTQTLALTVGAASDYTLAIANSPLTTQVNAPVVFNGRLTAMNGYASTVNLSCDPAPPAPPTCVANPASVTPSISGAPFTVTVSSAVSQQYAFNITGAGRDPLAITHPTAVNLSVLPVQTFDFTLSATPSNVSVTAGSPALYSLDVSPTPGTFPSVVTFTCSTPAALTTCTFSPTQVPSGSGDSVVTMTVLTTAPIPSASRAVSLLAMAIPLFGVLWMGQRKRAPKSTGEKHRRIVTLFVLFLGFLASASCGGGLQGSGGGGSGSPGTLPGVYNITVTATSGGVTHSNAAGSLTLTVNP
jgi:hypothetical protein